MPMSVANAMCANPDMHSTNDKMVKLSSSYGDVAKW